MSRRVKSLSVGVGAVAKPVASDLVSAVTGVRAPTANTGPVHLGNVSGQFVSLEPGEVVRIRAAAHDLYARATLGTETLVMTYESEAAGVMALHDLTLKALPASTHIG